MNQLKVLIIKSEISRRFLTSYLCYTWVLATPLWYSWKTSVNIAKFLRTIFFIDHLCWLLLKLNTQIQIDITTHICKFIDYFYMMVSLSFYGMKALWNRDKSSIKNKTPIIHNHNVNEIKTYFYFMHRDLYDSSNDSLMSV